MNLTQTLPGDRPSSPRLAPDLLEARVAMRLSARLTEGASQLPHDISERLRVARGQALAVAQARRRTATAAATATAAVWMGNNQAALQGPPSWWLRLASVLPLLALVAGLVLIQQYREQEMITVAAEIDTALLADELPPEAYGDPGFAEYLKAGGER